MMLTFVAVTGAVTGRPGKRARCNGWSDYR